MKITKLAAVAGFGLLALSASAEARTWSGYAVANVNERAGPSTAYPSVAVIPAGAPIVIYGCLSDDTWCDVSWGPNRGWMSAAYIQVTYQSRRVPLNNYISPLGIPFVVFSFDTYWGDYYRHRPFFHQEDKWRHTHADHNQLPPPPKGQHWDKPVGQNDNNPSGNANPSGNNPPSGTDTFHKPKGTDHHFDQNGPQQNSGAGVVKPKGNPPSGTQGNSHNGGKPDCVMQDGKEVCPKD